MVLPPGAGLHLASLWAAYKAWCEFCLCECSIKGTNPPAPGMLPLKSFCIHFSNDNSLSPTPGPHLPKAGLLKKPPYMVILLTHRQLAFLGTLFKEDPPLGFYIALVFVPKTHQPSVIGRRPLLRSVSTVQALPPGAAWPPGCRRSLQIGLASMTLAPVTRVKALRGPASGASALLPASGPGTSWGRAFPVWTGAPCPRNGAMGGTQHLRSLLILLARGSAGLHSPVLRHSSGWLGDGLRRADAVQKTCFFSGYLSQS